MQTLRKQSPEISEMSGEYTYVKNTIAQALEEADSNAQYNREGMLRALIVESVAEMILQRSVEDITHELNYIIESLSDDSPVITRGC